MIHILTYILLASQHSLPKLEFPLMMPKVSDVYRKINGRSGNDAEGIGCLYRRISPLMWSINRRHYTTIICIFAHLSK